MRMLNAFQQGVTLDGLLAGRRDLDRAYLMSLTDENLLLPYYMEAGLRRITYLPDGLHGGWDSPLSDIRGTVCGHWLSAAAQIVAETGDAVLKARADRIVGEIGRCQEENGNGWCFPIPEKYLYWLKRGKHAWAPQYVCHKVMMGLLDMARFAGNEAALSIVKKSADWFLRFTDDLSPDQLAAMMTEETGGMMELFADLYALTGEESYRVLMERYERRDLFEALERGEDPLANCHANTTVPEIHGAARAYEVTGDPRYRKLAEQYWKIAVEQNGVFSTGGHTSGEVWIPAGRQYSRLGDANQEHCVVYNMMRLADYLFRWTGGRQYMDYWERNLYNGILAQGFRPENRWEPCGGDSLRPIQGYVAYYLPLQPGSVKHWGSATGDFWCCHCTLMQANASLFRCLYYQKNDRLIVAQYQSSSLTCEMNGASVTLRQWVSEGDITVGPNKPDNTGRPGRQQVTLSVYCDRPAYFSLSLRIPGWTAGKPELYENGKPIRFVETPDGFLTLERTWEKTQLTLLLPRAITIQPLADRPDTVAFLDGPVALAGLTDRERVLYYHDQPEDILVPHNERKWTNWGRDWKTTGQPENIVFRPLFDIADGPYTVYFPLDKKA